MKFKRMKFAAALAALAAVSMQVQAECSFPKAPDPIPNGATATEAEMIAAMQAFKAYKEEVTQFGSCLDEETKEKSAGTGQIMQLKTLQAKKLNAAVSEMESKAKEFNDQVRVFKGRG